MCFVFFFCQNIGIILFVILSIAKNLFVCLRRSNFSPEQEKLEKKCSLKNFQSYFQCWTKPTYPRNSARQSTPALRDRLSLVREEFSPDKGSCSAELVGFVSTQSDKWKIFRLFRAVFPSFFVSKLTGFFIFLQIWKKVRRLADLGWITTLPGKILGKRLDGFLCIFWNRRYYFYLLCMELVLFP